ncbi:MAG TPA: DNA translocase FtsK [Bacilli bacterium]|jgi:S-DNA-T family DNA segregation ATPase FtsK/SpoIIIE|nr:hypothetical protein [Acholeplasmataceae bacterium]OQB61308.1 MAG: DNA translocase SftA [Tenericutes bacterium ADurb.Bin140]HON64432.1 DNA translocase FtsK [Bacilli bacterium]HOR96346.1 DNA translocase FtsK [Bacilli bacterium]HPD12899.1 DNA translocase FtsK [Bacilli bacterium]
MKERRRDFYIASITEPKQEEKKETAQVQSPPSKPDTKPNEFISPFLGRQKNTVGTPPAVSYGNAGKQYEGYRKQRKLTPEEIRRQNASYVLNTEQYKQILKKGIIPQISEEPVAPKPSYEETIVFDDEVKASSKKDRFQYYDHRIEEEVEGMEQEEEIVIPEEEIKPEEPVKRIEHKEKPKPRPIVKPKTVYKAPPLSFLKKEPIAKGGKSEWAERCSVLLNQVFNDFDFGGEVAGYIQGPSVTQFLINIKKGTTVKNITALEKDLLRYLEVRNVRIQDPIPGTSYAGIEVPNAERKNVLLGNLIDNPLFLNDPRKLQVALGIDISGEFIYADIAKMPHGLIAGATNSGKSVCINSMIISLLYKNSPEDLRLILIDPKMVELSSYDDIPHLAMPVITDSKLASQALKWAVEEMERRFVLFNNMHLKNIVAYNKKVDEEGGKKMPYIVIIIDELSDLMMVAANEVESHIQRLTQKARAAGIHVIVATQRPSTDIIRGSIKNNILVRAAFRVASNVDSRTILDHGGAETLLGNGDMLYSEPTGEYRLQGAYVDDGEISRVTSYLRDNYGPQYLIDLSELEEKTEISEDNDATLDPLFNDVAYFVVRNNTGSNNKITQAFKISFNRADRMLLAMENLGIVSSTVKGKQREVLVSETELEAILNRK